MSHEDPVPLIQAMSTEDILSTIPDSLEGIDVIREVFRKELMATAKDGRYSGFCIYNVRQTDIQTNFIISDIAASSLDCV